MKILILLSIIFVLSFVVYDQDVFAASSDCRDPSHCYALVRSSFSLVEGLQYELDSPDLWIDRNQCNNIAVSTGWLVASAVDENDGPQWVEGGVTKGVVRNVGCVTQLSTYYAFNSHVGTVGNYQEFLVPNGRVDPGDNIQVKIQTIGSNQVQIYLTTPDSSSSFPRAQVSLNPANIYRADVGIEGTVSAADDYSSISMSKFTNIQIKQNGSWKDLPSSATKRESDPGEGYIGQKCGSTGFVAGSVMSLDCNVAVTKNQSPIAKNQVINIQTNSPLTISLDDIDTDKDYLAYHLVEFPTNGFLDHINKAQKIPNTDGDSAQIIYTPASTPPESDTFRYSVTDYRDGHTREGLVTINGPTPAPKIPDVIDDFRYTLDGTTINFNWSEPDSDDSEIQYLVERSHDTIIWMLHDWYGETNFSYDRHEGYDEYFRVFAKNNEGFSAPSNVRHVNIPDTTPPVITINKPTDNETIITPDVFIDGSIYESQDSGIEDIKIWLDGTLRPEIIDIDIVIIDSRLNFKVILYLIPNGVHSIMITAENGDGILGSQTFSVTVDTPVPQPIESFDGDFQNDMSDWYLTTGDDEYWSIRTPNIPVSNLLTVNKVAGAEDCDDICSMTMIDYIDLTQMSSPTLEFSRYVSTTVDIPGEGIIVYVSEDNGNTWSVLDSFIADELDDDGLWHKEKYDLNNYSASIEFKLRFDAISNTNSEDTEIDNLKIYDADADTTPPIITIPSNQTFEATALLTILNSNDYGTATAIDTVDPNPAITNDASTTFPLGDTTITWMATDDSGNQSADIQIITIQDTTSPILYFPDNSTFLTSLNSTYVERGASAIDIVDGNLTSVMIDNSSVDTSTVGGFRVNYNVTDSSGNTTYEHRGFYVVNIAPDKLPTIKAEFIPTDLDREEFSGQCTSKNTDSFTDFTMLIAYLDESDPHLVVPFGFTEFLLLTSDVLQNSYPNITFKDGFDFLIYCATTDSNLRMTVDHYSILTSFDEIRDKPLKP